MTHFPSSFEEAKSAFIKATFVRRADADYLRSREAFDRGDGWGYAWHASQSLEKYSKATLLYLNLKAPRGHSLDKLLDAIVEATDESFWDRRLSLYRPKIKFVSYPTDYQPESTVPLRHYAVTAINTMGHGDTRYGLLDARTDQSDYQLLDQVTALFREGIRRFSFRAEAIITDGYRAWPSDSEDVASRRWAIGRCLLEDLYEGIGTGWSHEGDFQTFRRSNDVYFGIGSETPMPMRAGWSTYGSPIRSLCFLPFMSENECFFDDIEQARTVAGQLWDWLEESGDIPMSKDIEGILKDARDELDR